MIPALQTYFVLKKRLFVVIINLSNPKYSLEKKKTPRVPFYCVTDYKSKALPDNPRLCVLRKTKLLFFNRREEDILWRSELDELAANNERYYSCVFFL